jgi:hypothetical protein
LKLGRGELRGGRGIGEHLENWRRLLVEYKQQERKRVRVGRIIE